MENWIYKLRAKEWDMGAGAPSVLPSSGGEQRIVGEWDGRGASAADFRCRFQVAISGGDFRWRREWASRWIWLVNWWEMEEELDGGWRVNTLITIKEFHWRCRVTQTGGKRNPLGFCFLLWVSSFGPPPLGLFLLLPIPSQRWESTWKLEESVKLSTSSSACYQLVIEPGDNVSQTLQL